jgi:hypothetical protein
MKHDPLGPAALEAVSRLLAPVVPLLLEVGVGIGDVETVLKRLYVEAARQIVVAQRKDSTADSQKTADAGNPAPTAAIAMLTGLTRSAVTKLLKSGTDRDTGSFIGRQRAERVISGWLHDPDYRNDRTGSPAILPLRGTPPSFTSLVKRHSGDPRVRTILTELRRVRAIRDHAGSKVELIRHSYAPSGMDPAAIALAGEQAADYIRTLVHNVKHPSWPLYTRCVLNERLDPAELAKLMRDCGLQAETTLDSLDAAINDPSATVSSQSPSDPVVRLGVGFFIFHDAAPSPGGFVSGRQSAASVRKRKRTPKGSSGRGK